MIKQVKHSLKCLPTNILPLIDFHCMLQEIMATINHRPLGTIMDSDNLMPNMLLLG